MAEVVNGFIGSYAKDIGRRYFYFGQRIPETQAFVKPSMLNQVFGEFSVHLRSISDRGYVVENGVITLQGKAKELLANEQVRAAYLGL